MPKEKKEISIASTKLNVNIIDKMVELRLSSNEIDFILYLAIRQNIFGQAEDIFYSEVMKEINISKQTFYNIKNSLVKKDIITELQGKDGYWTFRILNNIYATDVDYKKRYLNVNKHILFKDEFKALRANEKILILKLLNTKNLKEKKSFKIYIHNLKKWLNVQSSAIIYGYIENIKLFFRSEVTTGISGIGGLIVFVRQHTTFLRMPNTEKALYFKHKLKMFCKKHKIVFNDRNIDDLITLINQYTCTKGLYTVLTNMYKTLLQSNTVQPKLIHHIIAKNDKHIASLSKIKDEISSFTKTILDEVDRIMATTSQVL